MYVRPEGKHLVLIGLEDGNPVPKSPEAVQHGAAEFTDRAIERVTGRLPRLADGGLHGAGSGVDGLTTDQSPSSARLLRTDRTACGSTAASVDRVQDRTRRRGVTGAMDPGG